MSHTHIVINNVGGGSDGQDLVGCYYEYKPNGTYKFFDKYGKQLVSNLSVGSVFNFTLDYEPNINWTLTIGLNSDPTIVIGNWSNPSNSTRLGRYFEQDGSYTAQAGGTLVANEMMVEAVLVD